MLQSVLSQYDLPATNRVLALGNAGGFSGASIWKLQTNSAAFALRRWPRPHPDSERLRWIHRVLRFAAANGCPEIVVPLPTKDDDSFVDFDGALWELNRWAEGQSFDEAPTPLPAAIDTLARFHLATARFHMNFTPSENLQQVIRRLNDFVDGQNTIASRLNFPNDFLAETDWQWFQRHGSQVARAIHGQLAPLGNMMLPVQPVIRDIRGEHLYFDAGVVCGVIDFGAMQIDSVACDLARLLGTTVGLDQAALEEARNLYHSGRQLSATEWQIVPLLIESAIVIGLQNWMRWIFVDRRTFESPDAVASRIQTLLTQLRSRS